MSLKIGDKVKMTSRGFKFYSNINTQFSMFSVGREMNYTQFTQSVCEQFAIHGIGTVIKFNSEGCPYIKFECKLNGTKYFSTSTFELEDVKKVTFFDKLILKLQGRI